ncbi:hypothetical protein [Pseudidiomarina insulisalsae]|uniref:Uncharacterized protein n=1 Tax=Pseudidiomarina insulisalsae TaxID=575789 RepID=A0A432YCH5_9GAMM|nr:hypothetical protein [Pseudidiomarina insulisalsae]RUO58627.1 hypothetical protein CWI71_10840 [Pseudidiomarina insulisalsae]
MIYELEQLLPDIKNTRWKKKTDFYSLFLYLALHQNQLPLTQEKRGEFREALDSFSKEVNRYISSDADDEEFSSQVVSYGRSIRASSDLGNRKRRHAALCKALDPILDVATQEIPASKMTPLQEGLFDQEYHDDDES